MADSKQNPDDSNDDDIVVHEVTIDIHGTTRKIELPAPPSDAHEAIIVVNHLGNPNATIEVNGHDNAVPNLSKARGFKTFYIRSQERLRNLTLDIKDAVQGKWTYTVAYLKRNIPEVGARMKCRTCKTAIKLVVSALLTMAGVPPPDIVGMANIPLNEDAKKILELLLRESGSALDPIFERVPGLKAILFGFLNVSNFVFDFADKGYELVCKRLKCC